MAQRAVGCYEWDGPKTETDQTDKSNEIQLAVLVNGHLRVNGFR